MQHIATNGQDTGKPQEVAKPTVLKSAAAMAAGTLTSRLLGMGREMVLLLLFSRTVSDAFVVAFRLPNLFRRVLGEGSLAATFIPLYVEAREKNPDQAVLFKNSVYTMLSVLTGVMSVLGILFMEQIMALMVGGEGFMAVQGKYELTVFYSRIMFSFLFLITNYAFLMSVANSHKIFFLPAMAPAAFNLVLIITAFFPSFRYEGDQLAYGVILAGVAQLAITAIPLFQSGIMPRLTGQIMVPRVKQFFRNVFPSMIGMSVGQILGVLNVYFGSQLPEGTHTYIFAADRLLEIPQALFSVSLGVALLPTLSELWARGEKEKMLDVSHRHIRLLLTLSLPAAVGLYVLAEPIVRVIYERGRFTSIETVATAQVLSIYAIVLVLTGIHRVMVPIFYAVKNTWLPATNAAICLVIHYFVASYATEHYGIHGLVSATAVTGFFNLAFLMISHRVLLGPVGVWDMIKTLFHLSPALVVLAVSAKYTFSYSMLVLGDLLFGWGFSSGSIVSQIVQACVLVFAIGVASVLFFVVARLCRHAEAADVLNMFMRKLRKKIA